MKAGGEGGLFEGMARLALKLITNEAILRKNWRIMKLNFLARGEA